MALNDQRDKDKQAEEWIKEAPLESVHFVAACEYVSYEVKHRPYSSYHQADIARLSAARNLAVDRLLGREYRGNLRED